jgi:Flp pilus assembly protein TadG
MALLTCGELPSVRNQTRRNAVRNLFRRLALETGGSEIAEAAAVLPLMFMILLGIFWFGQAFNLYGAITRAAQEGARAGAAPYCTTCTSPNRASQNAANAVQAALTSSKLDPNQAQFPGTPPSLLSCIAGTTGNQGCDGTASTKVCVQTPVQLTSTVGGAAGVCGIAVTFQYPFKFYLPFTSVNNQQILLTASARVRMETR